MIKLWEKLVVIFYHILGRVKFFIFGVDGWQSVLCRGSLPILNIKAGDLILGSRVVFIGRQARCEITIKDDARVVIGNNSLINQGVNIVAKKGIVIGNGCLIGDQVCIRDHNSHEIDEGAGDFGSKVKLGNNVWIGARAIVLAGVSIGDHSVVAAGSIVTSEVPSKVLVAGVPAKIIRSLKCSDSYRRK